MARTYWEALWTFANFVLELNKVLRIAITIILFLFYWPLWKMRNCVCGAYLLHLLKKYWLAIPCILYNVPEKNLLTFHFTTSKMTRKLQPATHFNAFCLSVQEYLQSANENHMISRSCFFPELSACQPSRKQNKLEKILDEEEEARHFVLRIKKKFDSFQQFYTDVNASWANRICVIVAWYTIICTFSMMKLCKSVKSYRFSHFSLVCLKY